MGRRSLPKIPADADLSEHLIELDGLQPPFRRTDYTDAATSWEIEVGSGKGLFLTTAAPQAPERMFFGIEIAGKYARFIAWRLARKSIANARIMHGNAEIFFRDFLPSGEITAVHIYFPDPWWKKRHHKRRIMNESFLQDAARVLRHGGRLHFWTDVQEYYERSLEIIRDRIPALHGPIDVAATSPLHDLDYRTHFERRKRQEGFDVYRAEFEKV